MINIDKKYNIKVKSNILDDKNKPENITKIQSLIGKVPRSINFVNELSESISCKLVMYDINTQKELKKSSKVKYHCFWDRCEIPEDIHPLGCPIRKVSNTIKKTYRSYINQDTYSICETVSDKSANTIEEGPTFKKQNKSFYYTDGIFCSFNCILAYIKNNTHKSMYNASENLLMNMYHDINGTLNKLTIAPDWRLLDIFGGYLDIKKYRHNFDKVEYEHVYSMNKIMPILVPLIYGYNEKIKL